MADSLLALDTSSSEEDDEDQYDEEEIEEEEEDDEDILSECLRFLLLLVDYVRFKIRECSDVCSNTQLMWTVGSTKSPKRNKWFLSRSIIKF